MKKRRAPIKIIVFIALFCSLLAASYLGYAHFSNEPKTKDGGVNIEPATADDQDFSDSFKDGPTDSSATPPSGTPTNTTKKHSVGVAITTWSQKNEAINVNGFVSGTVEKDGVCTLTLTSASGHAVTASQAATANATNTSCGLMSIPVYKLNKGTWEATISYSSSTSTGSSKPISIEVE